MYILALCEYFYNISPDLLITIISQNVEKCIINLWNSLNSINHSDFNVTIFINFINFYLLTIIII